MNTALITGHFNQRHMSEISADKFPSSGFLPLLNIWTRLDTHRHEADPDGGDYLEDVCSDQFPLSSHTETLFKQETTPNLEVQAFQENQEDKHKHLENHTDPSGRLV